MIPDLRDLSYETCLRECGLTRLETWTLRGNHISFQGIKWLRTY